MNLIAPAPAPSGGYRTFRDEAVANRTGRVRRREALRRSRNALLAALVLAGCVLSASTAASLRRPDVAPLPPHDAACIAAGERLAPWFAAEADRKALVGLERRDDFNLLLTWFRSAQGQCAAGQAERALENLTAVERKVAERSGQGAPDLDD